MSEHRAMIHWKRESPDFSSESYNRGHRWEFNGSVEVPASAAPDYRGDPERVDPEQAIVASMSSCHMLTFLHLAARKGLVVDEYSDQAVGVLEKGADGKLAITRAVLRPKVKFGGGNIPSSEELAKLHEHAHEQCFIANSVRTSISVEPQ